MRISDWSSDVCSSDLVFTDFRCGYCRALAQVLREMNVRVVKRPISVLGSRDIADRVYCAKDREAALHAVYAGETLKPAPACNTSGLDANEAFATRNDMRGRSEAHTYELQSLMRISYAVFCMKK